MCPNWTKKLKEKDECLLPPGSTGTVIEEDARNKIKYKYGAKTVHYYTFINLYEVA